MIYFIYLKHIPEEYKICTKCSKKMIKRKIRSLKEEKGE